MTSNQVRGIAAETIEEQAVAQYLQHNADFFERHPQLLARLRLQHPRNGATVSLIERQVEVLREKYQAQEQKLAEFVRVARANNVLAEKIHRFTRRLLRTSDARTGDHRNRSQPARGLRHLPRGAGAARARRTGEDATAQRFLRRVAAEDPSYRSFESLFATGKPRCGQIRDSQREFLFGSEAPNIGSVALIPLGGQPRRSACWRSAASITTASTRA